MKDLQSGSRQNFEARASSVLTSTPHQFVSAKTSQAVPDISGTAVQEFFSLQLSCGMTYCRTFSHFNSNELNGKDKGNKASRLRSIPLHACTVEIEPGGDPTAGFTCLYTCGHPDVIASRGAALVVFFYIYFERLPTLQRKPDRFHSAAGHVFANQARDSTAHKEKQNTIKVERWRKKARYP